MNIIDRERVIRSLRKTPVLLKVMLNGVTQERASQSWDGDWNAIAVMCHMRDYEEIVMQRVERMLSTTDPGIPVWDQEETAAERDYVHQQLAAEFETYLAARKRLLDVLLALPPDQWKRYGTHPEFGMVTILEMCANMALHDINHIEQMARALGIAESLF